MLKVYTNNNSIAIEFNKNHKIVSLAFFFYKVCRNPHEDQGYSYIEGYDFFYMLHFLQIFLFLKLK